MAKIIKKNRDLEKEYQAHKNAAYNAETMALIFSIGVVGGFILFIARIPVIINIAMILGCGVAVVKFYECANNNRIKANIIQNGINGETITKGIIEKLPDEYFGFQNVKVTYNGETNEIDMVVLGPNGVFVIETKNLNGHIRGYETKTWIQEKIGRKGTPYSKTFYSPVKQVGTHIYRLANFLRSNGEDLYVNGAVYFSNPEATFQGLKSQNGITVFCSKNNGEQALTDYILSRNTILTKESLAHIYHLLNKCTLE